MTMEALENRLMKTILCYGDSNTWGYPPVADLIVSSDIDGVHFELDQHRTLGLAVAEEVRRIVGK